MADMTVKVYRFDPARDQAPRYDVFTLPCPAGGTVMDVLDHIHLKLDHSLSYYKHSACDHGICGRCILKVNGKPLLACTTALTGEDLILEPMNTGPNHVKDLVVRY